MKVLVALCVVLALSSVQIARGSELCEFCQKMASVVSSELTSDNEHTIENAVKSYCASLPASVSGVCSEVANSLLPEMFKMAEQELKNSTLFCEQLGLCPPSAQSALTKQQPKKVFASTECLICEFAMSELDKILVKNSTQAEIEEAILKVCSVLPSTVRSECTQFFAKYGPEIVDLLLKAVSPKALCTELGVCKEPAMSARLPPSLHSKTMCSICSIAMTELDELLKSNNTEVEIVKALDQICNYLPSMQSECQGMVKQYVDLIIDSIKDKTPTEACTDFGLCP